MIARGAALAVLLALAGCQTPAPAPSAKPSPAGPPPPPMAAEDSPVMCPADVQACADGSYVSRTGPRCEFAACPSEKK
ncbi:MAG: hypothetical protein B7Y26_00080 [Hydrogenophilales bacterium 16-64-46]|nr:MAG: hypothetical protein B7Z32_09485 [Hydrogenophilales bacterium 12-64-13]OYZ07028.1 MAG: hypothetical protein B7Y26_00080 [Hydrogenophilales bacterium 16-64-46]OZA37736.1 MAG: hypothetical protein B7X87_09575 [Hydrogenophilales bacterium 17-64-34]HQS99314.1 hypothetical protein [Thiobacillus sp.]